jgi:chromosome segregation ATPase
MNILSEKKMRLNPRKLNQLFEHLFRFNYSLQDEINRIKKEWNHQLTQISKEHANENIEYRSLQDECDTFKAELKIKDNHINRYKKELEDALDRERALEEAKAQLDIDWQKKFDQSQRQEYHKSEDLIEKISSAHEQVRQFYIL